MTQVTMQNLDLDSPQLSKIEKTRLDLRSLISVKLYSTVESSHSKFMYEFLYSLHLLEFLSVVISGVSEWSNGFVGYSWSTCLYHECQGKPTLIPIARNVGLTVAEFEDNLTSKTKWEEIEREIEKANKKIEIRRRLIALTTCLPSSLNMVIALYTMYKMCHSVIPN